MLVERCKCGQETGPFVERETARNAEVFVDSQQNSAVRPLAALLESWFRLRVSVAPGR